MISTQQDAMNPSPPRSRAIFLDAIERDDPDVRAAFVAAACHDDESLRSQVERLLRAHEALGKFEGDPSAHPSPTPAQIVGQRIGPYELESVLGEGGMGVVYLAQQREPVQRRVAIKLIRPGLDSRRVLARFDLERATLAQLDHPHIARVLDAGVAETGRPYVVMEWVPGRPLHAFCDEQRSSLRQRLELFAAICQAVQHAHQKGIIHRDLKPSNMLVARYEGTIVPKVIDFGVAKAVAPRGTDPATLTGIAQLVGTLEYMSPEQTRFDQTDLDTRTDIYSLGVVLYQLVTGATPLDARHVRTAGFDETLRMIREQDPPTPSTRLRSSDELAKIAANRQLDPVRLRRDVRGELDWIVMKCLEKDRERRYATASELAADVDRYLRGEPVEAHPPSAAYRLGKFARRHAARLAIVGLAASLFAVGAATLAWNRFERGRRQERFQVEISASLAQTTELLTRAAHAADSLDAWRSRLAEAELEQRRAEQRAQSEPELLAATERAAMAETRHRLELQRADWRLSSELERLRLARAELDAATSSFRELETTPEYRQAFAEFGWSRANTAIEDLAVSFGDKAPPIQTRLIAGLDDWLAYENDPAERQWLRAALAAIDSDEWRGAVRDAIAGRDRVALVNLAQAAKVEKHAPATLANLAHSLLALDRPNDAFRLLQRSQPQYPADFWLNQLLARVLSRGVRPPQPAAALGYFRIAVALRPDSAGAHLNLAGQLIATNDLAGAQFELETALRLAPDYAEAHYGLALLYGKRKDHRAAVEAFREATRLQPAHAAAWRGLAFACESLGELPGAIEALERVLELEPRAENYLKRGHLLRVRRQLPAAIASYRSAAELASATVAERAEAECRLGLALREVGDLRGAVDALRRGEALAATLDKFPLPAKKWLEECERQVPLQDKLPRILSGEETLADGDEGVRMAEFCETRRLYATAARLYEQAFAAFPDTKKRRHWTNAAVVAALASGEPDETSETLDDAERQRWRRQAIEWLRTDVDNLDGQLADKPAAFRKSLQLTLEQLQKHPRLRGLRDPRALERMPAEDQALCRQFWIDVENLLAQAKGDP